MSSGGPEKIELRLTSIYYRHNFGNDIYDTGEDEGAEVRAPSMS